MWSTKVCTSRTEVPRLGLKPRSPGERPWPRASQAKTAKSGRSSSSARCAMRPECSWPRWKSTIAPCGVCGHGRPMAVEQLDAVVRLKRLLVRRRASRTPKGRESVTLRDRPLTPSARPARTRLTMVTTSSKRRSAGISQNSQPGSGAADADPAGRARRRRSARSLLPSGPS